MTERSRSSRMQYHRSRAPSSTAATRVEQAQRAEQRGHDREREQHQGVDQHLVLGPRLAPDHRHHRDAGPGVVGLLDEGERPEVGRRPVEDDGEQVDRGQVEPAGHRRPAHQRRKGAGRAADHDVLRARPLEPDGVDEHVEQEPAQGEPRAERVDPIPEDGEGRRARAPTPNASPNAGGDPARRESGGGACAPSRRSMSRSNHMLMALAPPAIR